MRKGRLPSQNFGKGKSEDGEGRKPCTCSNSNFACHVCRQCQKLICLNCRSGEHKHHETDKINVVAGELRNGIEENIAKQTKSVVSDYVQKGKQMIVKMKKELMGKKTNNIQKIDKRIHELHKELDEIRTELVTRVDTVVREEVAYLKKKEMTMTAIYIKSMLDAAKNMLEKANDIDIVKGGYSMCKSLNDISMIDIATLNRGQAFNVQFVPGTSVVHDIKKMCGEVIVEEGGAVGGIGHRQHKMPAEVDVTKHLSQTRKESGTKMTVQLKDKQSGAKVTMVKSVSRASLTGVVGDIWGVCATADNKCWFTDYSDDIKLVDVTGLRHRTLTVGVRCTSVTTDGSSMYVTCDDRSIKKISLDHKVTNIQTSLSFYPAGLTFVPATGEMLVCGMDDGVFSVTESGEQRILTCVKFQFAWDIDVNNNGDICVTDRNKVFIFNSDKRHIGTYDGHGTSIQNKMDARGVTCDSRGYFIIADNNNNVLHFINRDGDNVSIYDTTKGCIEHPRWIDISPSGRLWVSFYPSTICVYETI